MSKKIIYLLLSILMAGSMFFSCENDNFIRSGSGKLSFSLDTLMFDTVFTTIGSTTQSFKVYNPNSGTIEISSIELAGGDDSPYRLNIDGEITNQAKNVEILPHDSIYIFVEVTVDPNGANQPMIVEDSVIFATNSNLQKINLVAWGQDFIPIRQAIINTTTWTADKPYLIYDYAFVDSLQTLTIEPGTRIFMHDSAWIMVAGTILAQGTPEKPITFQGDRLEEMYSDVPNQWLEIMILPNITQSVFENVEIKNSMIGLQVGSGDLEGSANVKLHNVKIEHITYYGLSAIRSNIEATNLLVDDCGHYGLLAVGGSYEFTHCTFANYWNIGYANRTKPTVAISNYVAAGNSYYSGDLIKANFNNSVIYGNLEGSELVIGDNGVNVCNYQFDHCMIKLADSVDTDNDIHYKSIIRDKLSDSQIFVDVHKYNFAPDTLSPLINAGDPKYGQLVPLDLNHISRTEDSAPDIGAYEYSPQNDEKKE